MSNYEARIPKNWTLVKMESVVKWGSGGTPKATMKDYYEGGTIPWLIIGDLNDSIVNTSTSKITKLGLQNSSAKIIPAGTLLVAMYGSIGKLGITGMECCTNQAIAFARELKGVTTKFMFYYFKFIRPNLIRKGKGGNQNNISQTVLKSLYVPIPPLSEQERIVAKIEELFSNLDQSISDLHLAQEKLEVYRQAVLKEAFEGKLTTTWRKSHPVSIDDVLKNMYGQNNVPKLMPRNAELKLTALPENWKWLQIGDISNGPTYGTSQKSSKQGKIPVVRMGNIQNGKIDWDDLVYTTDQLDIEKYQLNPGDVLFNRTNSPELVGKTAIYCGERPAIFAGYLIRINQIDYINPHYLTYYMNSFTAKNYGNHVKTDGVNQSNINGAKLRTYPFPLCSQEEQKEIVIQIESRLSECDAVQKTISDALQQAEALRQSILKDAFEGRL